MCRQRVVVAMLLGVTFTLNYFKRVVQNIDTERPDGVRDRALLLGLARAFRRDELASIDLVHPRFDEDGLVVELPKSNQSEGRG
ncbi:hypothetical protein EAH73_07635 [Hymenobacter nivis]|uniref:Uncharacterized protein n=1 Tax=Hymenobacter nivis TaxID=1850093 RepID=A0A502H1B8_9BACT|nr:hypothetical protein EAH73_07635 [Hymenobacter nivis]